MLSRMKLVIICSLIGLVTTIVATGCEDSSTGSTEESEGDSDSDTDTDMDIETDADTDADTDTDANICADKKGVGAWNGGSGFHWLEDANLAWYYNWNAAPNYDDNGNVEFVPMCWGKDSWSVGDSVINDIKNSDAVYLLGFNEPDRSSESNMTVDEAIALWPKLESTGKILGSPAMGGTAYQTNGWLDQFMTKVDQQGLRVDFVAVHVYQTTADVDWLLDYLDKTYEKYGLPIWITEWSLVEWYSNNQPSMETQAQYLQDVIEAVASLDYVQRHAWFAMWESTASGFDWPMYLVDGSSNSFTVIGESMRDVCLQF